MTFSRLTSPLSDRASLAVCAACALLVTGILFALTATTPLSLADEGWHWHASVHTAQGEIPLRDFQSYDPGRYYWFAAWMLAFGPGIETLRLATAAATAIGLFAALLVVRRVHASPLALMAMATLLALSVRDRFEAATCVIGLWLAVRLLEQPTMRRHIIAGIGVGLAGFIGRNVGVYNGIASLIAVLIVWLKTAPSKAPQGLAWLGVGALIGYAPALLLMALAPGFAASLIDSVALLWRLGRVSLVLPIAWPWVGDIAGGAGEGGLTARGIGWLLIMMPVLYGAWIVGALRARREDVGRVAVQAACGLFGMAYLHYVFGRADMPHLTASIYPFLLGLWAMLVIRLGKLIRSATARKIALAASALVVIVPALALVAAMIWAARPGQVVRARLPGGDVWLTPAQAESFEILNRVVLPHMKPGETLMAAPFMPGLYPALGRKSPLWETYFFWPAFEDYQLEMIDTMKRQQVNWAIVSDVALDGMDERRFSATHPLVWRYIQDNFKPLNPPVTVFGDYQVLRRSAASP